MEERGEGKQEAWRHLLRGASPEGKQKPEQHGGPDTPALSAVLTFAW